jgi:hypothetical protein
VFNFLTRGFIAGFAKSVEAYPHISVAKHKKPKVPEDQFPNITLIFAFERTERRVVLDLALVSEKSQFCKEFIGNGLFPRGRQAIQEFVIRRTGLSIRRSPYQSKDPAFPAGLEFSQYDTHKINSRVNFGK